MTATHTIAQTATHTKTVVWHPLMFSAPMVAALLAGTKTVTRRCPPSRYAGWKRGERVWVRETWRTMERPRDCVDGILYADGVWRAIENTVEAADRWVDANENGKHGKKWRPSIFMRQWMSRITLELTEDVRFENLQRISRAEVEAEGFPSLGFDDFAKGWDAINGKRQGGAYAWKRNPEVAVIRFRVVKEDHHA